MRTPRPPNVTSSFSGLRVYLKAVGWSGSTAPSWGGPGFSLKLMLHVLFWRQAPDTQQGTLPEDRCLDSILLLLAYPSLRFQVPEWHLGSCILNCCLSLVNRLPDLGARPLRIQKWRSQVRTGEEEAIGLPSKRHDQDRCET